MNDFFVLSFFISVLFIIVSIDKLFVTENDRTREGEEQNEKMIKETDGILISDQFECFQGKKSLSHPNVPSEEHLLSSGDQ